MNWTALPVVSCTVECERPYSFYFNLIEPYWRTPPSDENPLHRLSSLARKQGAKAIVFENAARIPAVAQEITTLDAHFGGGGAAEAIQLSFLSEVPTGEDVATVGDDALIGQCTLINYRPREAIEFQSTFVYEAIFATPSLAKGEKLLNNFINVEAPFKVAVNGRTFNITGLYYAHQNGTTSVCAHACIRMATRTLFPDRPSPSTEQINSLIGDTPPADGMEGHQVVTALEALTGYEVASIGCEGLEAHEYVSVLTSAVDSGEIALLIFDTGEPAAKEGAGKEERNGEGSECDSAVVAGTAPKASAIKTVDDSDHAHATHVVEAPPGRHVVVVFGYTRNTDEWHPQAIPGYSGAPSALYYPSSAWVDHFIIHDDNYGPYLALSSRALESNRRLRANEILIIRRIPTDVHAQAATIAAGMVVNQLAQMFAADIHDDLWLSYLVNYHKPLVTRPILMTREQYIAHLLAAIAHDGSSLPRSKSRLLSANLPNTLWVVEFTLPDLFTGNHTKLGEIVFDAAYSVNGSPRSEGLCGIRVPSRFMLMRLKDSATAKAPVDDPARMPRQILNFPLASHTELYERNPPRRQW